MEIMSPDKERNYLLVDEDNFGNRSGKGIENGRNEMNSIAPERRVYADKRLFARANIAVVLHQFMRCPLAHYLIPRRLRAA